MVGGEPVGFERARPLLDAVAKRVIYTGAIGTVSIAKIMHNSASFTLDLVMAECWTVGVKAGIDVATIVNVFNEAALGQMMSLKVRCRPPICAAISILASRWRWRARISAWRSN
jgi:3-hydroxyisobutyrate dehydrogenase